MVVIVIQNHCNGEYPEEVIMTFDYDFPSEYYCYAMVHSSLWQITLYLCISTYPSSTVLIRSSLQSRVIAMTEEKRFSCCHASQKIMKSVTEI